MALLKILERIKPKLPGILKATAAAVLGGVLQAAGVPAGAAHFISQLFGG